MAYAYEPKTRLDQLKYSPTTNPLAESAQVKTRSKLVRSGRAEMMANIDTGEIKHVSLLHEVNQVDQEHFVKIFAAGVIAMFELSRTAQKVFNLVLQRYQAADMTGGFSDSVNLFWFNNGLDGQSIGISEPTFKKGLRELIDKNFLWPKQPNIYWVNPNLFFKGDRVLFVKEYRKVKTIENEDKTK